MENKRTFKNWLYEAMSEKGIGSAKRLAGIFITFVSMGCIIYLTITSGPTIIVENLLQTSLITGAALLGLSSITSIWKHGSMSVGENGDVNYKGDDSKQVLEDVLSKKDDNSGNFENHFDDLDHGDFNDAPDESPYHHMGTHHGDIHHHKKTKH